MKKFLTLAFATLLFATPAFAMDLGSAKSSGLIGEKADGYVGAVSSATPEVAKLIETTNSGRAAVYADMASKQGVSPAQIGQIAAQKLIDREAAGNYVQVNGAWVKK